MIPWLEICVGSCLVDVLCISDDGIRDTSATEQPALGKVDTSDDNQRKQPSQDSTQEDWSSGKETLQKEPIEWITSCGS